MRKRNGKQNDIGRELSKLNLVSIFGATVAGNIVAGFLIGKFLDKVFDTGKVFLIIFIFVAAA